MTFGMVDTNSDPNKVDFAIPSNDDATKSIAIIVNYIAAAIAEGLTERQAAKDDDTVEDITSDENEKKAARIQAEAESEAAVAEVEWIKPPEHQVHQNVVFRTAVVVQEPDN